MAELTPAARYIQECLTANGCAAEVIELSRNARTAAQAAAALHCEPGQIVKSLIFRAVHSGRPVLVLTSGVNRVDEQAVAAHLGEPLAMADAAFVHECTGFEIGGVPPIGHRIPPVTFIDEDLLKYSEIWAAAGTPRAQFRITPARLQQLTGGTVIKLRAAPTACS